MKHRLNYFIKNKFWGRFFFGRLSNWTTKGKTDQTIIPYALQHIVCPLIGKKCFLMKCRIKSIPSLSKITYLCSCYILEGKVKFPITFFILINSGNFHNNKSWDCDFLFKYLVSNCLFWWEVKSPHLVVFIL